MRPAHDSGPTLRAARSQARRDVPDQRARVRFLRTAAAHGGAQQPVTAIETHMSWVFLAGDRVLKLKKPVKQLYLDFSTLASREFHCREELRLNERLAPGVYRGLCALCWDGRALSVLPEAARPPGAEVLDWLVLMRRLPADRTLDAAIARGTVTPADIDRLADRLLDFYRGVPKSALSAADYCAHFAREQALNRQVLRGAGGRWPDADATLDRLDDALRVHAALLGERAQLGFVVDGHGDLRPQHVCLLQPPVVIDALEFNLALRQVDPLDEIAFLGMECAQAGAHWIGPQLARRCVPALGGVAADTLVPLYAAYRALLRARLSLAHLLEPVVRRRRYWRPQARRYIGAAMGWLDVPSAGPRQAA